MSRPISDLSPELILPGRLADCESHPKIVFAIRNFLRMVEKDIAKQKAEY